jgi:hypothetical protein
MSRTLTVLLLVLFLGYGLPAWSAKEDPPSQTKKRAQPRKQSPSQAGTKPDSVTAGKSKECIGIIPKITKVQPDEGKAGSKITITGKNFGVPGCLSMVSFGPGSPAKFVHKDDTTVTATVPDTKKGLRLLTINTPAGQDSKPFLVR